MRDVGRNAGQRTHGTDDRSGRVGDEADQGVFAARRLWRIRDGSDVSGCAPRGDGGGLYVRRNKIGADRGALEVCSKDRMSVVESTLVVGEGGWGGCCLLSR